MKPIRDFFEEAHQISLIREREKILNEILSLLENNKIKEAKKILKEHINKKYE